MIALKAGKVIHFAIVNLQRESKWIQFMINLQRKKELGIFNHIFISFPILSKVDGMMKILVKRWTTKWLCFMNMNAQSVKLIWIICLTWNSSQPIWGEKNSNFHNFFFILISIQIEQLFSFQGRKEFYSIENCEQKKNLFLLFEECNWNEMLEINIL